MTIKQKLSRRSFLAGAGALSVAGAAALVATKQQQPAPALVKTSKPTVEPGAGYQLTAHVRNYYRSTTV